MQFAALLPLILSTPSFAHINGPQVLVDTCGDGHVFVLGNTGIPISCATRATTVLSSSLTSQSFPSSNSTATSHNSTLSTNHPPFTSTSGASSSTRKSFFSTGAGVGFLTAESSSSRSSVVRGASSISSSTSSQSFQPIFGYHSLTSPDISLTSTTSSLESNRSGESSTYITPTYFHNNASTQSINPSGSSTSRPSRSSRPSDQGNALSSSTTLSSTDSQSATYPKNATTQSTSQLESSASLRSNNSQSSSLSSMDGQSATYPKNATTQSTSQLESSVSLRSNNSQSYYRGTGPSSLTSTGNHERTFVSSPWTSPEMSASSRASSGSTEASSNLSHSSATPGSTFNHTNSSSRHSSDSSPVQPSQKSTPKNAVALTTSPSVASSTSSVTISSSTVVESMMTVPSSIPTGISSELGLNGKTTRSKLGSPLLSSMSHVAPNGAIIQTDTSTFITTPTSITGLSRATDTTSLGNWPAIITFCSESNGHPVVGYGFVTTFSSGSSVTNTIPSQTLISFSTGLACAGEVAVINNGLTTTIELSTLPSVTPYPQLAAGTDVQVLTQSSNPVVYEIETLSGYTNSQPILISTDFTEVVNGQTTTQAGWWLIGYHGRIEVPKIGPWRTTSGSWGCIGGPALCNAPCGDVDIGFGFFVHLPLPGCSGQTGPPGWPGGPIIGGSLPPFPEEGPGEDPGSEGDGDPDEQSTAVSAIPSSASKAGQSTVVSSIQSSASKAEYFIIASPSAVQGEIQAELELYDPSKGGTYEPDVGDTSVSGGTWIDYQLDANQSAIIASRTDIILIMECTTVSGFETGSGPTTDFANVPSAVSFDTMNAEPTATSLGSAGSKNRRNLPNVVQDRKAVKTRIRTRDFHEAEATIFPGARNARLKHLRDDRDTVAARGLQKRDTGTRLVRQVREKLGGFTGDKYPSDLAVMAWAPGVPSIAAGKVDYIFEETKGEDTWVYIIDSGVAMNNLVRTNTPSNLLITAIFD